MKLTIDVLRCQESLHWILWWCEGLGCPLLSTVSIEFSCETFSVISVASVGQDVSLSKKVALHGSNADRNCQTVKAAVVNCNILIIKFN